MTFNLADTWHGRFAQYFIFLVPVAVLSIKSGAEICFAGLILISLYGLARNRAFNFAAEERIMLLALLAYPLAVLIGFVWYQQGRWSEFDAPARFLLAIPVLLYLLRADFRFLRFYRAGCALGCLSAAVWAVWSLRVGSPLWGSRVTNYFTNPVPFACIALVLAYAALPFGSRRPGANALVFVCALLGVAAAVGTGARAVLLVIPCATLLYLLSSRGVNAGRRHRAVWLGVVIVALACSITFALRDRIEIGMEEIAAGTQENPDSSLGYRRQLWSASTRVFLAHPVFGVGRGKLPEELHKLAQQGVITPAAAGFRHSHNEFLFLLSETGLIGAAAVAALYLNCLICFARRFSSPDQQIRAAACLGLITVISYIGFGLADCMLTQNTQTTFFAVSVVLLYAHIRQRERRTAVTG